MESKHYQHGVDFYFPDFQNCKYYIVLYLEERRLEKNLSQRDLSNLTGIPQKTISYYENGKYVPSVLNLFRLAYALHIDEMDNLIVVGVVL